MAFRTTQKALSRYVGRHNERPLYVSECCRKNAEGNFLDESSHLARYVGRHNNRPLYTTSCCPENDFGDFTVNSRYLSRYVGRFNDRPAYVAACCPPDIVSSSSGSIGPCSCCQKPKETYFVTYTLVSGNQCNCISGFVVPIRLSQILYEPIEDLPCPIFWHEWKGMLQVCGGTVWVRFRCPGGSTLNNLYILNSHWTGVGSPPHPAPEPDWTFVQDQNPIIHICDPFEWTYAGFVMDALSCANPPPGSIGGTFNATVTE